MSKARCKGSDFFNNIDGCDGEFEAIEEKLRKSDKENNLYQFTDCDNRNIILFGRARTGKTTIVNVIKDATYVAKEPQLYAETRKPEFHSVSTYDTDNNKYYYFNFIDIPGFFDVTTSRSEQLSRKQICGFVDSCATMGVSNIHMFAFVFSLFGGINEHDIETMLIVKKTYPLLSKHMALILTHCEHMKPEQIQKLINDFFLHPKAVKADLREYFTLGTFSMGCIRFESYEDVNDRALYREYSNVFDMRNKFIEKCIKIQHKQAFNIHKVGNACTIL